MDTNKKRRGFMTKRGQGDAVGADLCLDSTQKHGEVVTRRPLPYPRSDAEMVTADQGAGRPANYRPSPRPRNAV